MIADILEALQAGPMTAASLAQYLGSTTDAIRGACGRSEAVTVVARCDGRNVYGLRSQRVVRYRAKPGEVQDRVCAVLIAKRGQWLSTRDIAGRVGALYGSVHAALIKLHEEKQIEKKRQHPQMLWRMPNVDV